jgi:hypothetical protein
VQGIVLVEQDPLIIVIPAMGFKKYII